MTQTIQAKDINLRYLIDNFGIQLVLDDQFFREWQENCPEITDLDKQLLDDETKQGAVEKVQKLLQKRLAKAEIIKIPVPIQPMPRENSLMKFAGIFQDDPDFLEIIKEIRAEREDNSDI